jgi:hypothetical protein
MTKINEILMCFAYHMSSDKRFKYNVNTSPLEQEARAQEVVPEGWY